MYVEVKGVNDILVMKLNQDCDFDLILNELDQLLDQPIFLQEGYYPRAFFDCGCRELENDDIKRLLDLLKQKKRVIFDGISIPYQKSQLDVNRDQVHNGEEVHILKETLFLGAVNPGSYVYCHDNVYFLNTVRGNIILLNETVKIYGHDFRNAQIFINQQTLHNLTTSALTSVYYKDDQIMVEKEDGYEQNYCDYIR